ncbi:related to Beta-mannosidase B [Phialocephala subalpina]|uniref:beta-mannosidase n=1 Tax=Phialocephala subalpina TaxID=576137 RepID=A0A1L7WS47_9HELO|nr:related to Beta-mannosidase B [Phialocephala subalpina]
MSRELGHLSSVTLSLGWQFRAKDVPGNGNWLLVSKVPSLVHLDLMENQKLVSSLLNPEPLLIWQTWTYNTTVKRPSNSETAQAVLVFEGLDTLATTMLDGKVILENSNMFLTHRVDITHPLPPSKEAVLEIDFASALLHGRAMEKAPPEHRFIACNEEAGRVALRKAQYHWGRDGGPILMTAGPWRPVRLEMYHARVADLRTQLDVSKYLKTAAGTFHAKVEGNVDLVSFTLKLQGQIIVQKAVQVENGHAIHEVLIENSHLWYPHGYGSQPLYDFSAEICTDEIILDTATKRIRLRRGELIQKNGFHGKSFYFRVNGVNVFGGRNCWVPADNFTPLISKDSDETSLLSLNLTDPSCRLGILIWQDFMFACASYPAWPKFLDSVKEEGTQNLRWLRHHPSIVIYAGNNEDYQVKTNYPSRYIFEHLLPQVMAQESPDVPYWPSSPYSEAGKPTSDPTTGDIHQWNVWHGTQEKYQVFESLRSRFNSDFSIEAFPHIQTIQHFVEDPSELYPQSHTPGFYNKADGHERRIATYLVENFKTTTNLEAYIHLTQLVQSEALMYAYCGWRKQWGDNRKCGGALV